MWKKKFWEKLIFPPIDVGKQWGCKCYLRCNCCIRISMCQNNGGDTYFSFISFGSLLCKYPTDLSSDLNFKMKQLQKENNPKVLLDFKFCKTVCFVSETSVFSSTGICTDIRFKWDRFGTMCGGKKVHSKFKLRKKKFLHMSLILFRTWTGKQIATKGLNRNVFRA